MKLAPQVLLGNLRCNPLIVLGFVVLCLSTLAASPQFAPLQPGFRFQQSLQQRLQQPPHQPLQQPRMR